MGEIMSADVLVFVFFAVGMIAIVLLITKELRKKIQKNFKLLGERLGLEYEYSDPNIFEMVLKDHFPELKGRLMEEYPIRIYIIVKGSGKNRIHYMAFDIQTDIKHSNRFSLLHEGFFRKMGKMLGLQKDIQINDEDFDQHFIIKSDSALYAKTILSDAQLRERLLSDYRLLNNGEIRFSDGILHYEGIKSIYNSAEIDNLEAMIYLSVHIIKRLKQVKDHDFGEEKSSF